MLQCKRFIVNPLEENTYVCYDDETGDCVIIDPGCCVGEEYESLYDFLNAKSLHVSLILESHLHFDHVWGAHNVAEHCRASIAANEQDAFLLDEEMIRDMGVSSMMGNSLKLPDIQRWIGDGDKIKVGNSSLHVLHVPGHSPGSLAFYAEETRMLFAGDLLFRCSVGRTDLPGGDFEQLKHSITAKIFRLPDDTVVWTGHGPQTTVGDEKQFNPYV